jgi:hypothetical protein
MSLHIHSGSGSYIKVHDEHNGCLLEILIKHYFWGHAYHEA